MQQIAVYANLRGYNSHNRKSLELYSFLKKNSREKCALNPDYRKLEDSLVVASGYNTAFRSLDKSNYLMFLARSGVLSYKEILLLPRINTIVANSRLEAARLAWQIRNYGYKTKVISIPPYCKITEPLASVDTITYAHLGKEYRPLFVGFNLVKTSLVQPAFAHVHLGNGPSGWPYLVLESMMAGIPSIVKNTNPVSEYIVHGHNGYVISDASDIVRATIDLRARRSEVSSNCIQVAKSLFDAQRYAELFIRPNKYNDLNIFGPIKIEHQSRQWIIREKIYRDRDVVYFPDTYYSSLNAVDLVEIIEILDFFSLQLFSDVYIFGCDLPQWYGPTEMTQVSSLITKLGSRARRIHFCRDELIPHQWLPAFKKLSLISVDEGLKQVSG